MLAQLINDASRGDHNAVIMLGGMAEQMSAAGGDLANLGAVLKDMIDGERDVDKLCTRVGVQGESLITEILSELAKLDIHWLIQSLAMNIYSNSPAYFSKPCLFKSSFGINLKDAELIQ